jgi:hypothetical protein
MDAEHGMAARGLSASIGIAMCVAGASADDLVVNADLAMYDAKEAGRDRWALYAVGDGGEPPRMKGPPVLDFLNIDGKFVAGRCAVAPTP